MSPNSPTCAWPFPHAYRPRARCGVRRFTDLGWFSPTLEGFHRMTDRRRTRDTAFLAIRWQRRANEQQGHSAPPRRWTTASFPGLRIKEPNRRGVALDTAIIVCAERVVASHQEPELTDRCLAVSTSLSRTRVGVVRMCADLGYSPLTLPGHYCMTKGRLTRAEETRFPTPRRTLAEPPVHQRALERRGAAGFRNVRIPAHPAAKCAVHRAMSLIA